MADGRIASLDDPIERYEPALADSAWKGVALRHVLNMASGVHFDETYDRPDTDIARLSRAWTRQQGSLLAGLQTVNTRDAPPGDRFKYVSANTQVLAQVLARATGRPLADYVSEKIWAPMGAEADAATTVRPADSHLRPGSATPYFGYGYQTWIFPDQLGFALLGVRGQAVFVHPKLKLVMVQTAVWPVSSDAMLSRQRDRFWREVMRAAGAM